MCGLMYHFYSTCYNQLQAKVVIKEAVQDRAKDVIRKLLEEYSGQINTSTHTYLSLSVIKKWKSKLSKRGKKL